MDSMPVNSHRHIGINEVYLLEPRTAGVVHRAAMKRQRPYCERIAAYETAKHEAARLVGFGAAVPELQSAAAWEALTRLLADVLDI